MAEILRVVVPPPTAEQQLFRRDLLRWLYVGRLTLVAGILAGALFAWFDARPQDTLVATLMFLAAVVLTTGSYWFTHFQNREPGKGFLYGQVILDALLVTGVVHVTGGPESSFASVYILVISSGALLLPLPGGVVVGGLASVLYLADLALGFGGAFTLDVALRIALFAAVAFITGLLGDRLRRAGQALGAVASQLHQLRLDTDDILANLSTGVLTIDVEGRLAYANPAASALLGMDFRGKIGEPVLDEVERVARGMGAVLERALHDRLPANRVRVAVELGGRSVWLGVSTAVLDRGGEERPSVTAIFQDITDSERLDELNVRAKRLEAVAELSASLAHEIKNPLASIRSAVEQLSRGRLAEADRAVLGRLVMNESDRLSRLLTEFLEYSVLKLGARDEVDLREVVLACVESVRRHPALEGVALDVSVGDRPLSIVGDADLLHRAIFNLVLNGAQSAGPGGRVTVSLRDDRARARARGTAIPHPVRLAVGDSGPGIPPEVMARIFDPFFTTKREGSGLGLAVVHRAVEAHSGATFVDRSVHGGAEFVIFLPGVPGPAHAEGYE